MKYYKGDKIAELEVTDSLDWYQTQMRGTNELEYQIYRTFADNGKGGDITNNGKPLKSFDEWMNS